MKSRFKTLARPFRHAPYRLYFSGQVLSFIGNWMQSAAQAWLMYRLTGSAVMLGLTAFMNHMPTFVLAPFGGAIADRYPRRQILMATQWLGLVAALLLFAVTVSGHIQPWQLLIFAGAFGLLSAFEIPARQALLSELVPRKELSNAIAMNSALVNVARIVGPAAAGAVIAFAGEAWCFLLNAVSYSAMIAALSRMRLAARAQAKAAGALWRNALEGIRFAFATRPIRGLLLLLAASSLFGGPYLTLMPIFAAEVLHGGPRTLGLLLAASGAGALAGALLLASRDGIRGLGGWVAVACAGFGLSLIAFAQSRTFALSLVLLPFVGFFMIVQMAATNTLIQAMVPDRLRARVMAVYSMTLLGMAPIGGLIAGALAHSLGAARTLAIGGGVCIVGAIIFRRFLPALRREARAFLLSDVPAGGEPAAVSGLPTKAAGRSASRKDVGA